MSGEMLHLPEDDRLLREFFLDDARGMTPQGLLERSLGRTLIARRDPAWRNLLRRGLGSGVPPASALRTVWIVVLLAALIVASLGLALLSGAIGPKPIPTPVPGTTIVPLFIRPFTYVATPGIERWNADGRSYQLVGWVQGPPSAAVQENSGFFGGQDDTTGALRGIVVGSAATPWTHDCGGTQGRVTIRSVPAEFLADLRDIEGAGLDPFATTRVDGRDGVASTLHPAQSRCATDFHVAGQGLGIVGTYVSMHLPARLLAFDVDGSTVFIQIWARDEADLAAWLPGATRFVDQIQFLPPN